MDCQRVAQDEIVEKYLNGKLEPAVQEDFEIHVLECEACLARTETFETMRASLASSAKTIRPPLAAVRRRLPLAWFGVVPALVAICAFIVGVYVLRPSVHNPANSISATLQSSKAVEPEQKREVKELKAESRAVSNKLREKKPQLDSLHPAQRIAVRWQRPMPTPVNVQMASQRSPEEPAFVFVLGSSRWYETAAAARMEEDAVERVARRAVFGYRDVQSTFPIKFGSSQD